MRQEKVFISNSAEETEKIGEELINEYKNAQIFAFLGDLGAGKTAMTRGMARACEVIDSVTSPTYAIVNEYRGKKRICHFDMYRITDSDALYDIGWEDYLSSGALCIIEWSENIINELPIGTIFIEISKIGDNSRKIRVFEKGKANC